MRNGRPVPRRRRLGPHVLEAARLFDSAEVRGGPMDRLRWVRRNPERAARLLEEADAKLRNIEDELATEEKR